MQEKTERFDVAETKTELKQQQQNTSHTQILSIIVRLTLFISAGQL